VFAHGGLPFDGIGDAAWAGIMAAGRERVNVDGIGSWRFTARLGLHLPFIRMR